MINNTNKTLSNLKITCLKILDKMPEMEEVKILKRDLKEEDKKPEQIKICLKVITLMGNYLEMGLIKFGD